MKLKSLTEMKRWATLRCANCGHRFRWSRDSRSSFGDRDGKVYHEYCIAYLIWRRTAADRLAVLDMVVDLSSLDGGTVLGYCDVRWDSDLAVREEEKRRTWRAFRDLDELRAQPTVSGSGTTPEGGA